MQQLTGSVKRSARYGIVLAISTVLIAASAVGAAGFSETAGDHDTTTIELDRDGADIMFEPRAISAGVNTATLYLDRDGADIPEGNWWGISSYAGGADASEAVRPAGMASLNLDRDGADVSTN